MVCRLPFVLECWKICFDKEMEEGERFLFKAQGEPWSADFLARLQDESLMSSIDI